jgi:Ser/Thr protein kinase RdoA (MazF antagonist)
MFTPPLDSAAEAVLLRYPPFCRQGTRTPLGNHGGFSGCALWRIDGPAGSWCLRAWPPHETWPRLHFRHELMTTARQHGLHFVPAVLRTCDGATALEHAGRWWEMTEWLPGRADFRDAPSRARLESACTTLAQLHAVWRGVSSATGACQAIQRRREFLDDWHRLLRSRWHPLPRARRDALLFPLVERAWRRLPDALEKVPSRLQRWVRENGRLQPCLCDPWHDHFLFVDERVRGVIDYGAVKVDHVAVDLARTLGSLIGSDPAGWQAGLQAYRQMAPLEADEEELAHTLDETGIVLGVANWMRWLYEEHRPFPDRLAVARRLTELVQRLETLDM